MPGALAGIRVLEFGQYVSAPLLGMLLADQGAEVIKVEPPGGEPGRRSDSYEVWNRGKTTFEADLADPDALARVRGLAAGADVVIENFRPGVADRLGIGAHELRRLEPRLVYCSLPGFGVESPYRDSRAWEGIVGARTATYRPTAESREPVYTPLPISSAFAAMLGAASITAALLARDRDGLGQTLEVPLHAATFVAMGQGLLRRPGAPPQGDGGPRPLVTTYRCGDGRFILLHAGTARFLHDIFALIGDDELTDLANRQKSPADPLAYEIWERLKALFLTRSAAAWEELFIQANSPGLICRTVEEWIEHPQAAASGAVIEVESERLGATTQVGPAVRLHGTPGDVPRGVTHAESADAIAWQRPPRVATSVTPVDAKQGGAAPLSGVRVLDLTIQLAGPACARTLAEFGADVIKIDNPHQHALAASHPTGDIFYLDTGRGKRSIALDLKTAEGRNVFWRLLERADVVVQNFRLGALERLGLGYEDVVARKPEIIYASINAYGRRGPWAGRPGWEVTAQALTGSQVRFGGRGSRPLTQPFPINDYGTGVLGAYAVLLALLERNRTGKGQHVEAALTFTASTMQSQFIFDYPGRVRQEVEGQEARGASARSRLYHAADGYFFLHLRAEGDIVRLRTLAPFAALPEQPDDATLCEALSSFAAGRTVAECVELLGSVGLSVAATADFAQFFEDATLFEAGLLVTREHPGQGMVTHLGTAPRLERTPVVLGIPAEPPGASTDAVLAEHGYAADEIAGMRSGGVVR